MSMMYCPRCETNVLAAREDMDICLLLILAIFTAGFGLIIYLIYYYSQDENRCIHCHSICTLQQTGQEVSLTSPVLNPYRQNRETQQVQVLQTVSSEAGGVKFCSNCGSKINRQNTSFCPFCGSQIK